jgi:hypothetical protein
MIQYSDSQTSSSYSHLDIGYYLLIGAWSLVIEPKHWL